MKYLFSLTLFVLITVSACVNSPKPRPQEKDVPNALTQQDGSFAIVSKRGSDDLVESLYSELSDKTPALKDLEFKIGHVRTSKSDSIKAFNEFNGKNNAYYNSANNHLERFSDSVLKEKIRGLIAASANKYNAGIQPYNELLNSIDQKTIRLNDLHTILKITQTLPLIEEYQTSNKPAIRPVKGYSKKLDEAIQIADTLIKK